MQTNPAVERSKIIRWSGSPWNQSGRKGKGLWRKGFAEEQSLEWDPLSSSHVVYVFTRFSYPISCKNRLLNCSKQEEGPVMCTCVTRLVLCVVGSYGLSLCTVWSCGNMVCHSSNPTPNKETIRMSSCMSACLFVMCI